MNVSVKTEVIRQKLIDLGKTQDELARDSGITTRGLEKILERGTAAIRSVKCIAKALDVKVRAICDPFPSFPKGWPERLAEAERNSLTSVPHDEWPQRFDSETPEEETKRVFDGYLNYFKQESPEVIEELEKGKTLQIPHQNCALGEQTGIVAQIAWDEENKRFLVHARFVDYSMAGEGFNTMKYLALDVCRQSTCSCGSTLKLSNYFFDRNLNGDIDFLGVYLCSACKEAVNVQIQDLRRLAAEYWRTEFSIELGPPGGEPNDT